MKRNENKKFEFFSLKPDEKRTIRIIGNVPVSGCLPRFERKGSVLIKGDAKCPICEVLRKRENELQRDSI